MIEDDINSHQCRFCNSSFSVEILKKIEDDRNDVYCENCGDLIKRVQSKYNFNPTKIIENASNTNDTPTKPQKDLESNPDALHYPIGRIFYDTDFPLIFKSNFIIVFSRLTYFHALHLESKGQIELGGMEVPENAINNLFMSIRHIQNKRIKSEFLNNLHEISKEEFERYLKQLQAKIQSSHQYREDFIIYSRWLISKVYLIISMKWNDNSLNKFERTIRDDLMKSKFLEYKAQYNLHLKINELSLKSEEKEQKTNPKEPFTKFQTKINYNKLLTDKIQSYIKNIDEKISFLFEPFESFSKMDVLFGLGKGYILRQRMEKNHSKIIAKDILDRMRLSLQNLIKIWVTTYPNLSEDLMNVQKDLINFINEYEGEVNPKPSSHYQMYNHHPNFIRDYFKVINTKEKAYWLGFIFADGWISRDLKKSGYYYRMGIGLSTKDKSVLVRFCNTIGLNQDYIKDRLSGSDFSEKKYPISTIRWGDQEFAKDLINLGVEYEYSQTKSRRVKIPKMPSLDSRELMLAFLLGFYDGDGTLGFNKSTDRIQPNLACSNKNFLLDIKNYFDIRNKISSREIENYSIKKDKIVKTQANSLNIGAKLFEELLKNYSHSMDRKKVELTFFKDYYTPKEKPPTPQRTWLRNKLPKETLEELLNIISPNMIAKILGVSRSTILRLIEEYGTSFLTAGHYLRIIRSVRNDSKSSDFYESYNRWINYLKKIGKFSNK